MLLRCLFPRCGLYVVALAVALCGCAPMTSSKEELQGLGDNEGIVIGSVFLAVSQSPAEESTWAFLAGRKAGDLEYSVSISEAMFNPFQTMYSVPAQPGKETVFVKKLPAGRYRMNEIRPSGLLAPQLRLTLGIDFVVAPRQTSYIGKLELAFPDRIRMLSPASVEIVDAQESTIEQVKREHPSVVANTVKALAARRAAK